MANFYLPLNPRRPSDLSATMRFVNDALASTDAHSTLSLAYTSIAKQISKCDDSNSLWKLLLSLGSSDSLTCISSDPVKHAGLVHSLFKMDPFDRPKSKRKAPPGTASNNNVDCGTDLFQSFDIADAYFFLVVNLLSTNPTFLMPFINMILRNFKKIVGEASLSLEAPSDETNNMTEEKPTTVSMMSSDQTKINKLHSTLRTALQLVPKGRSEIFPVICQNFPYKKADTLVQQRYARECLNFISYIPTLQFSILELIVNKCLEIDVEIKILDSGAVTVEEEEPANSDGVTDSVVNDGDDIMLFSMDDDALPSPPRINNKRPRAPSIEADEYAEKLDSLLLILFEYLKTTDPRVAYDVLVPIFDNSILLTHKSKFVQFVFVHICGLDENKRRAAVTSGSGESGESGGTNGGEEEGALTLSESFVAHLLSLVFNPSQPRIHRQCAASYAASFVSRTNFTSPETVATTISSLLNWCEHYLEESSRGGSGSGSGNGRNGSMQSPKKRPRTPSPPGSPRRSPSLETNLFYTIAQASFYVMCFRGKEAMNHYNSNLDDASVDISPARWERLCSHPLQPLRHCLESVRREFCIMAEVFNLVKVETIKPYSDSNHGRKSGDGRENGSRPSSPIVTAATMERKRQKGGVGGLGKGSNPLDSFFPFDPYLLRLSYPIIGQWYLGWAGSACKDLDASEASEGISEAETESESEDEEDSSSSSSDSESDTSSRMPSSYTSVGEVEIINVSATTIGEKIQLERKPRSLSITGSGGGGSW